jgi:L-ascorbate metabolism protein UlaG (beta-lactamase superfamily)
MQSGSNKSPVLGYVLRGDGPSVFFCGSSGYFDSFSKVGRQFSPDISLLPIGGFAPFRKDHMSPLDAIYAFEDLASKIMIPIRYGSFALSYEKLHVPGRWLAELVAERDLEEHVVAIAPGQSRIFVRPSTTPSSEESSTSVEHQAKQGASSGKEQESSGSPGAL